MTALAPKARFARVLIRTATELTISVTEADGTESRVTVSRLSAAAVRVEWFGRDAHTVLVGADRLPCDCRGCLYRDDCRHAALARALWRAGELDRLVVYRPGLLAA